MPTDLEIAASISTRPIAEVAEELGIKAAHVHPYGRDKAKLSLDALSEATDRRGKLVLVTAVTPTPAGEGKTTTTVGLAQGLRRLGARAVPALREPSLGPVFGVKGGAAGGGWSQVLPMEDINLHFTGDLHAIGAANNLLAALIDNHLQSGNAAGLDPRRITWRRCLDMNDRSLRSIVTGLGGPSEGVPRETGFDITAASEIMAVLCLSTSLEDLKERLERMVVGLDQERRPVRVADIGGGGALAALLREALLPNLVQTIEGGPALVHGGPFANIAHGCSSVLASRMALAHGDICVTEAGFGADLGAEKFLHIKCAQSGLAPDAAVLVATVRALKWHGGAKAEALSEPNPEALAQGLANLRAHVGNLRLLGIPVVVSINRFVSDIESEIADVERACAELGVPCARFDGWSSGGAGSAALAEAVLATLAQAPLARTPLFAVDAPIETKLEKIASRLYGATRVDYAPEARRMLAWAKRNGYGHLGVCIAKTQYSFTDDPSRRGLPTGHVLGITDIQVRAGAGFVVARAGSINTMPGLPALPAALAIDCDADGRITGLF